MKFLFTKAFCDEFIVINEQNEQAAMPKTSIFRQKWSKITLNAKTSAVDDKKHNL